MKMKIEEVAELLGISSDELQVLQAQKECKTLPKEYLGYQSLYEALVNKLSIQHNQRWIKSLEKMNHIRAQRMDSIEQMENFLNDLGRFIETKIK